METNIKTGTLETIGYLEPDATQRIAAFLAQSRTEMVLMDIRKRKQSRWRPQFNKSALLQQYGVQYVSCPEFGNVNYKGEDRHKGIVLVDPAAGVRRVVRLLAHGVSVMLLCGCKDYQKCHRKTVYELIMAAMAQSQKPNIYPDWVSAQEALDRGETVRIEMQPCEIDPTLVWLALDLQAKERLAEWRRHKEGKAHG